MLKAHPPGTFTLTTKYHQNHDAMYARHDFVLHASKNHVAMDFAHYVMDIFIMDP